MQEVDFGEIEAILQKADDRFTECEEQWKSRMGLAQAAQDDEQRRRAESLSSASTSVANGMNGDRLFPSGINISYEYVRGLGRGTYGDVAAVVSANGELYARKQIQCVYASDVKQRRIEVAREVDAMKSLRHHHIVSVIDWTLDPVHHIFSILVSPVGDGHLGQYLHSAADGLTFGREHDRWFGCLVTALNHAHVNRVIHQDIKPSNIIIKGDEPYLADFGTAKTFSHADSSKSEDEVIKGTPNYLAPEDQSRVARGRATDVFSLGCVFAEMLTVRQGRDLQEFREWRRNPDPQTAYPYAFRGSLDRVQQWLNNLECQGRRAHFLRAETLKMLQEQGEARPDARSLRRDFRGEDLVCDSCS